jgi:integration host factor subunit alpha
MARTKIDLVEMIRDETGIAKKECITIVDDLFEIIKEELAKGNPVNISGFGKWSVKAKKERRGRNPQSGEDIIIDARNVVTFKPSNVLRDKFTPST